MRYYRTRQALEVTIENWALLFAIPGNRLGFPFQTLLLSSQASLQSPAYYPFGKKS